jgi:hypothetical protein
MGTMVQTSLSLGSLWPYFMIDARAFAGHAAPAKMTLPLCHRVCHGWQTHLFVSGRNYILAIRLTNSLKASLPRKGLPPFEIPAECKVVNMQ